MNSEKLNNLIDAGDKIVEIKARSVEDILEELYSTEPDYDDYEFSAEDYYLAYPEENQTEPLPYTPFDATLALRELSKSPLAEKPAKLKEIKDSLQKQTLGITSIIKNIEDTISINPETTADNLYAKVENEAPRYKLSEAQLNIFKFVLDEYEEKHKMVDKYRKMYPEDEKLFEACFGQKPSGEIKVIERPMTIHFQCLSPDDYALAYNIGSSNNSENEESINLSGGVAIAKTKVEELKNAVTVENVHNNLIYEVARQNKTAEIHNEKIELTLDAQKNDINIEIKGQEKWEIKIIERDGLEFPVRIQLYNGNQPNSPIFDLERTDMEQGGWQYFGFLNKKEPEDKALHMNVTEKLENQSEGNSYLGEINVDYSFIKIIDESPEGMVIKYQEDVALPLGPDQEYSKNIQAHEVRHRFQHYNPQSLISLNFARQNGAINQRFVDRIYKRSQNTTNPIEEFDAIFIELLLADCCRDKPELRMENIVNFIKCDEDTFYDRLQALRS